MSRFSTLSLLLCLLLTALSFNASAQTGNGQITGTVQDGSRALVPGVTITLVNANTGVSTTALSNEQGIYNFPVVPPGTYNISAGLPGFKTSVTSGVQVSLVPVRVNITLEIGQLDSKVEVTAMADAVLSETSASVGTVLPQKKVEDLPIVGQNILSLLDVLPGFRAASADAQSTIGGLNLDYTNTTINGLSTVSSRDSASFWGRQVLTTNVINPDLVGEIRLILSPVDAELGRGNSQIQIQTRSGTNKFNGSAVWNVQNTALNANTWANKRNPGTPTQPDWYNLHQLTGSYGGPIIRNKTFFFVLYDKQLVNRRELVSTSVLTDSARQGIWRWYEGWNPAAALAPQPTSFITGNTQPSGTAPAINFDGSPLAPVFNPDGSPYSLGGLRCISVYGNKKVDGSSFTQADCPGGTAIIQGTPWDTLRTTVDPTGYMANILNMMPRANFFGATGGANGTDGLNTATYRYLRGRTGSSATNASIGTVQSTADYNNRDQINIKIDHNLNANHRVNVAWTYEKDSGAGALAAWDGVLNGNISRRPQFVTVNATSTLSSNLVNEARFGLNYSSEFASPAWANVDKQDITDAAQKFILYGGSNPANGKKYPVLYNPGGNFNGYINFGSFDFANYSPLYNYADTIRWTRGKHSFSVGGEYRRPSTVGYNNSAYVGVNPTITGQLLTATPLFFTNTDVSKGGATLCGAQYSGSATPCYFPATARGNAGALLSSLYGAINAPNTTFWIDGQADVKEGKWQDVTTVENRIKSADPYGHQTRSQIQNEWSFFGKDDYKLNNSLTLNIGIRWDYMGSPYLRPGLTNTLADEGLGLFGATREPGVDPFSTWLTPGKPLYLSGYGTSTTNPLQCSKGVTNPNGLPASTCDPSLASSVIFVGPETDNPDKSLVPQHGMWSPAIGFSWQLPWFGEGKTTIRGGFQRTFGKPGSPYTGGLLSGPGADGTTSGVTTSDPTLQAIFAQRALNLTDLALVVPAVPARAPQDKVYPVGMRSFGHTYALFDPDFRNPHTDNFTLTIQRSLNRNLTLEIRAVNTLARNQAGAAGSFGTPGTFDLNTVNVYHNPELFNALENTRKGLNDPLFDQMLMGTNLANVAGYGPVGGTTGGVLQRGSAHIRRAFGANLANGNYAGVVSSLLTAGPVGLQPLPIDPATGVTLARGNQDQRALRNGCDRIANNAVLSGGQPGFLNPDTGQTVLPRCFPENYLIANPQWNQAVFARNIGYSNYNSLEAQLTMRPVHGMSLLATYGLSKTMVQPGSGFTDPLNPTLDFGKSLQSVGHDFRTNGTFELPIGPNKLLFANSGGWIARALERWQLGFIYNISSGSPRTINTTVPGGPPQNPFPVTNFLYANGRPNIVGPWTNPRGKESWDGQNGSFFEDSYATYTDPQCAQVTTADNLQASCTLRGLAKVVPQGTPGSILLSSNVYGIPLLENPQPGNQGNLGAATMYGAPRWRLDGNLSKTFQVTESKQLQLRVDATNIFNHPTPDNASFAFTDNFGQITNKTGSRTFQARLRLTF